MSSEFLHCTGATDLCLLVNKTLTHVPGNSIETFSGVCSQVLKKLLMGAFGIADILHASCGFKVANVIVCCRHFCPGAGSFGGCSQCVNLPIDQGIATGDGFQSVGLLSGHVFELPGGIASLLYLYSRAAFDFSTISVENGVVCVILFNDACHMEVVLWFGSVLPEQ